ncbi:unnamed protein product [Calypogeia fissa]
MNSVCTWEIGFLANVAPHPASSTKGVASQRKCVSSSSARKKNREELPITGSSNNKHGRSAHSLDSSRLCGTLCSTSTHCPVLDDSNRKTRNSWSVSLKSVLYSAQEGGSQRRRCVGQQNIVATGTIAPTREKFVDDNDYMKAGGEFIDLVQLQARKPMGQEKIGQKLEPISDKVLDLIVIGCGPAGLSLAAEVAKQGLSVGLVGPDLPFTNNYGVWEDEFAALGLENCIGQTWKDSAMYFESDTPLLIGRAYGRVDRHLLREELLKRCAEAGVQYLDSEVERISDSNDLGSSVMCDNGAILSCRLVAVASGAAAGKFLRYEPGGPGVTVQTAYGIEVDVENFNYDPEVMMFMDYRDYKGWGTENCPDAEEFREVPSFLYAMPVSSSRVFFEETCLAARPTMSFNLLKERLLIRLEKMGIKVLHIHEEEWSYIPVGATLPDTTQQHLGFGAAASMVHPATGYSVVRSLSEAPAYAAAIAAALRSGSRGVPESQERQDPKAAALAAWDALWPQERKRQRAFFLFGLELILQLDLEGIREFFATFFDLPEWLWKGFLAAKLTSLDLVWFSVITFVVAPNNLRYRLVSHLLSDPSGIYLLRTYMGMKGSPTPIPSLPPMQVEQSPEATS